MRLFKGDRATAETAIPTGEPVPMDEYALHWLGTGTIARNLNLDRIADRMGVRDNDDPRMNDVWLLTARTAIDLQNQLRIFQSVRPKEPELFDLHARSLALWLCIVGKYDNLFAMMQADEGSGPNDWYNGFVFSDRSKAFERFAKVAQDDVRDAWERLEKAHPAIYAAFNCHLEVAERLINEAAAQQTRRLIDRFGS